MSPCPVIYASWFGGQRYFFCEVPEIWATYALNCDVQHLSRLWYPGSLCTGHHVMWLLEWMLPCPTSWGENLVEVRIWGSLWNVLGQMIPRIIQLHPLACLALCRSPLWESSLLLHSGDYLILLSLRPLLEERQWSTWLCQKAGKSGLGKPWLGLRTKNTIL